MGEDQIRCVNCGRAYPETGAPAFCPDCGGLFDFSRPLTFDPAQADPSRRGVFRFLTSVGPDSVSLGEGDTPLVWAEAFGREVAFKCEYQNPTGSFKDRGSAALVSFLLSRGVTEAVEDSSGNAGASFAAYAARAGIKARVFVPESASGPKLNQIRAYGAEVVTVPGPRENAETAAKKATETRFLGENGFLKENGFLPVIYASHAAMPFSLPGYATLAYEIFEQLGGRVPGAILLPAGQGGLLLGAARGFDALRQAGAWTERSRSLTREAPRVVGVQSERLCPLAGQRSQVEGQTIAEGIRNTNPLRKETVRKAVESSGGWWETVEEETILPGRDALARKGFYVEPTSAVVWRALEKALPKLPDPVVVILTGSGLKFSA
ncbi:MAG: pyridoxal-phosphate dependent enzyme [Chloroflexota bacterium]